MEIDWEDKSGMVGLREWDKRLASLKTVKSELDNIQELSVDEWLQLVLYLCKEGEIKTKLFKELFVFSQRTGLGEIFRWYPYERGPYSDLVESSLSRLKENGMITEEPRKSRNEFQYKVYRLKKTNQAKQLFESLPKNTAQLLKETVDELAGKTLEEVKELVYSAYPRYAVSARTG